MLLLLLFRFRLPLRARLDLTIRRSRRRFTRLRGRSDPGIRVVRPGGALVVARVIEKRRAVSAFAHRSVIGSRAHFSAK
jgi:hypothetical protein